MDAKKIGSVFQSVSMIAGAFGFPRVDVIGMTIKDLLTAGGMDLTGKANSELLAEMKAARAKTKSERDDEIDALGEYFD